MLSPDEIKQRIDTEDMIRFIEYFGGDIGQMNEEYITFTSICHGSDSHKFYYYPQTKSTHCFVCSNVDIFTIIQQELDLTFNESLEWAEEFFGLGKQRGFGRKEKPIFKPREIKKKEININEQLPSCNKSILNTFYDIPIIEWVNEGISIDVLKQFGIRFDINSNSIIIPCYDINDRLVGIRMRNLNEDAIDKYGKYTIYTDEISGKTYKFLLSKILYGLNINKDKIMETKTAIIVEGEKSVLKSKTWNKENDITVCSFGSTLKDFQIELLKSLGVETLIFLYDYETEERILKKMNNSYKKASLYFNVYTIGDYEGLIDIKSNILDYGEVIYRKLLDNIVEYKLET